MRIENERAVILQVLGVVTALALPAAAPGERPQQKPPVREAPDPRFATAPEPPVGRTAPPVTVKRGAFTSIQVNVDLAGNNKVGDAANEPSIAVDPNDPTRIVIGWRQFDTIQSNFRQAGFAYSHDGGASWRFPGVLDPGVFRSDPVLDVKRDGEFVYSSLRGDFTVWTYRSPTSGVSWFLPPSPSFGGDKQWIAVDRTTNAPGSGNLYMAWSTAASCCGSATFTRSTDGGVNWMNPITPPFNPIWGQLAVAPDSSLFVAGIRGDTFDTSAFAVIRSQNAKNPAVTPTFPQAVLVNMGGAITTGGPNPSGLLGQLNLAVDHSGGATHGNVYLLASVDPSGNDPLNVHFIRSTNGGASFSAPKRVNDDPAGTNAWQWFGTMSVAPNGRIDAVWNDTRNSPSGQLSELFYASSSDAGVTWTANVAVSPPFNPSLGYPQQSKLGDYYDMVSDHLGAHVAYAATFNGEQDVYYLRIGPQDCNGNGVDDATDIAGGASQDTNGNGRPDECETLLLSKLNPGLAGQTNQVHITRARPGSTVFLLYGQTPANISIGSCPGPALGILAPQLLGPVAPDATGHVTLSGSVAGALSGATILMQPLEGVPCRLGNVVTQSFP